MPTNLNDLPPIVPEPTRPENLHLSRDEFIKRRKADNLRAAKIADFSDKLDNQEQLAELPCDPDPVDPEPMAVAKKVKKTKASKA